MEKSFSEFCCELREAIEAQGFIASITQMERVSGSCTGMSIRLDEEKASVVNLDALYHDFSSAPIEYVASRVIKEMPTQCLKQDVQNELLAMVEDYGKAKDALYVRLTPASKMSAGAERETPHRKVFAGDCILSVCIGIDSKEDEDILISSTVSYDILNNWEISEDRMFLDALNNMRPEIFPVNDNPPIMVAVGSRKGGAAGIFCPGAIERIKHMVGSERITMFPASTEDVYCIATPQDIKTGGLVSHYDEIVRLGNMTTDPEDILSDCSYTLENGIWVRTREL